MDLVCFWKVHHLIFSFDSVDLEKLGVIVTILRSQECDGGDKIQIENKDKHAYVALTYSSP